MIVRGGPFKITGTSPASATTAQVGSNLGGLGVYDWLQIDAILAGGTGGVLDLCLQKLIDPSGSGLWADWLHFPQIAAAGAVNYSVMTASDSSIFAVGTMVTAVPANGTIVLAAGTFCAGHPGDVLRLIAVAGSGTSAGAVQTINVTQFKVIT